MNRRRKTKFKIKTNYAFNEVFIFRVHYALAYVCELITVYIVVWISYKVFLFVLDKKFTQAVFMNLLSAIFSVNLGFLQANMDSTISN